jgi:hypothetical protein
MKANNSGKDPAGTCKATQRSDQMFCERCGIQWDVNDPDPPDCPKPTDKAKGLAEVAKIKEDFGW